VCNINLNGCIDDFNLYVNGFETTFGQLSQAVYLLKTFTKSV